MVSVEWRREEFSISTDPSKLDLDAISSFLSRSYWAQERPRAVIERSVSNSNCFGLFHGDIQIGFARVVSDCATFAWLCDVFIDDAYRGQGLGKWLMSAVMSHPELQGLKRWMLATRDAHGLYAQFGWKLLSEPEKWMELV